MTPELELASFQARFQTKNNLTAIFILVMIVSLFLLEEFWGGSTYTPTLVRMGANVQDLVWKGEIWRLFTSIFLHAGYWHVLFNGYVLFALGIFFDRIFGGAKFISLFLLSGLFGNLASILIGNSHLSVGASGALWGLFGASAALTLKPNSLLPEIIRIRMRRVTLINLLINIGISFLPAIDFWAHIGGGVGGFLIGVLYMQHAAVNGKKSFSQPLAIILSVTLLVSFSFAFAAGQPWCLKQKLILNYESVGNTDVMIGIPSFLHPRVVKEEDSVVRAEFGEFPFDPLLIFVRIQPIVGEFESAEAEFVFLKRHLRQILLSRSLQLMRPPQTKKWNGFSSLEASFLTADGIEVLISYQVQEKQLIEIEIAVLPGTPSNLLKQIPQIFASAQKSGPLI